MKISINFKKKFKTHFISVIFLTFLSAKLFSYFKRYFNDEKFDFSFYLKHSFDFDFVTSPNNSACNASERFLFVALVITSVDFYQKRMQIRSSWAKEIKNSDQYRVFFVLGKSKSDRTNQFILQENSLYNDIIQEDVYDSYQNLTLKIMLAYKWMAEFCYNTYFILRINDDVLPNKETLSSYLKKYVEIGKKTENTIMGNIYENSKISRVVSDKFYVSFEMYSKDVYERYVEGSAYLISIDLAASLFAVSRTHFFYPFSQWLEDIYIGILCKFLEVKFVNINNMYLTKDQYGSEDIQKKHKLLDKTDLNNLLFIYVKENEYDFLWERLNERKKSLN